MNKNLRILTFFVIIAASLGSLKVYAAAGAACGSFLSEDGLTKGECKEAYINAKDKASLQRGAQVYMNYCLGCHSLKYARYKKVSEDLEIPLSMFQENLIFGDQKMGDLIQVGMDPKEAKEWFGNAPPDLTLEAGLRGPDWIYTYLTSFYIDESRPLGVNNKVYENVGMPHVLIDMQGTSFQLNVWSALCDIPRGQTESYISIATSIGAPKAARAVGTACKMNPVPLFIPCHRVIKQDQSYGAFALGAENKKFLLNIEAQINEPL